MAENAAPEVEEKDFDDQPTDKEGFLYKQGKGESALGRQSWQKRRFVMKGNYIAYYKGSDPKRKGMICIHGVKVVPSLDKTRKNPFEIKHSERRSFFLDAETKEEQLDWLRAISEVALSSKKYRLPMKEYREILGVTEDHTKQQVAKLYKRLALKAHPDKGGSVDKFKEICEAYEIMMANFDEVEDKKFSQLHTFETVVQKGPSGLGLGLLIKMLPGGNVVVGKTLGLVEAQGNILANDRLIEIGGLDVRGKAFKEVQGIAIALEVGSKTNFKFERVVVSKDGEFPPSSVPMNTAEPAYVPGPSNAAPAMMGGGAGASSSDEQMVLFGDEVAGSGALIDDVTDRRNSGGRASFFHQKAKSTKLLPASKSVSTPFSSKTDPAPAPAPKMTPPPIPVLVPTPAPAPAPAPLNGSWQETWEHNAVDHEAEYQNALRVVSKFCPLQNISDGEALKLANSQLQQQLAESHAAQVLAAKAYSDELERLQTQIQTLWKSNSGPDPTEEVAHLRSELQCAWTASHSMAQLNTTAQQELQQCRSQLNGLMGGASRSSVPAPSTSSSSVLPSSGPKGGDDEFLGGNPMMDAASSAPAKSSQSAYLNELKKNVGQGKRVVGQGSISDIMGGGRSRKTTK